MDELCFVDIASINKRACAVGDHYFVLSREAVLALRGWGSSILIGALKSCSSWSGSIEKSMAGKFCSSQSVVL